MLKRDEKSYNDFAFYYSREEILHQYNNIYNHRFKRVVSKGQSDDKGKFIVHNVYVGKEYTIYKISFITDRDNFDYSVA